MHMSNAYEALGTNVWPRSQMLELIHREQVKDLAHSLILNNHS